ncbi:Adenosylcobalamin/alpha-ribazole phosphatase [Linum grandiflorum]
MEAAFLKNKYWVLRHGKSIPNEKGIIVSSLENGVLPEYQLAEEGIGQAQLAGELFLKELKENSIPLDRVRICYSPFARTSHTAKLAVSALGIPFEGPQCKVIEDLRERYFGPSFELMSHDKYAEIWALDEKDPFLPPEGGESVNDVATRLSGVIARMESEFERSAVLVVSHGDPLQILQTILHAAKQVTESTDGGDISLRMQAVRVPSVLSQHRKFALQTGELRGVV